MGKASQKSAKYVIEAKLESNGVVKKPDVVGAIFGQTEGLLGEELDLRSLQKKGKIGRIQVDARSEDGKSTAKIEIPTSLDSTDTALIAASLETIERVGPTRADIKVEQIRDERTSKRDYIVKRAKQLLEELNSQSPDHKSITEEVKKEVRTNQLEEFQGFTAGPRASQAPEVILVEGRADVINLVEADVRNCVALGGTSIPPSVERVVEGKKVTVFVDGDRGGDLIVEELAQQSTVDFVAKAPEGKEVEELGEKEIHESLRDKKPFKYYETNEEPEDPIPEDLEEQLESVLGTRALRILNEDLEIVENTPVENPDVDTNEAKAVVVDGTINQEMIDIAEELGADFIAGMERTGSANSSETRILTKERVQNTPKQ